MEPSFGCLHFPRMEKEVGSLEIHREVTCFAVPLPNLELPAPPLGQRLLFIIERLKHALCLIQPPVGAAASPPTAPSPPETHFNLRLSS